MTRTFDAKLRKTSLEAMLADMLVETTAHQPLTVVLELMAAADRCRADVGSPRPASLAAEIDAVLAPSMAALDEASRAAATGRGAGWDLEAAAAALMQVCALAHAS